MFGFEGILQVLLHLFQISAAVVVAPAAIFAVAAVNVAAVDVVVAVADAAVDVVAAATSANSQCCFFHVVPLLSCNL